MNPEKLRRACVVLASIALVSMGARLPAAAAVVGTPAVLAAEAGSARAAVEAALDRADVQAQLAALGVDRAAIEGRLAALTPAELGALADQIGTAPAGGDALAVIGVVFVVLVILEFVGVIDIFKKA